MIFGRLGVIQRDQRGFTMIELLVAILIASIVTGGVTMTIAQVFNTNTRNSSHMIAIRQVQNAGKQVSQDLLQAQRIDTTEDNPDTPELELLTLTWTDWDDAQHEVTYIITVDNKLLRSLQITPAGEGPTIQISIAAEYIDPDQTSCYPLGLLPPGAVLTFTVTANVGGQSETRVYEVKPRPPS